MKRFLTLLLTLVLIGCAASTVIAIIDSGLVILETISTYTGTISPAESQFFQAASDCLSFASTEISTTDPPATQRTKIIAACNAAVKTDVTSFNPALIALATNLVTIINNLISSLPPSATLKLSEQQKDHLWVVTNESNRIKAVLKARH